MPKPRSSQISLEATPYYHCISRCVRRAFLCGFDHVSGESCSNKEIAERWHLLFKGTRLSQKFLRDEDISEAEWIYLRKSLDEWRSRLMSISWFMWAIN